MAVLSGPIGRYTLLLLGIVEMVFFSGIHYGFNPLIRVYERINVYSYLCLDSIHTNSSTITTQVVNATYQIPNLNNTDEKIGPKSCPQQDNYFSYAFIVWTVFQCFITLPVGSFFDHFGISITKTTGAVIFFLGCLCYGFTSEQYPHFVFAAGCFVSSSNQFLMLSNLQISQLFPRAQNLIVSLLCGAFDSSSVVLTLIVLGFHSGVSVLTSFLVLGIAGIVLMPATTFILMPRRQEDMSKYAPETKDKIEIDFEEKVQENLNLTIIDEEKKPMNMDGDVEIVVTPDRQTQLSERYPSLRACICSRFYIFHLIFFSTILLRFSFFLTSLYPSLITQFGKDNPSVNRLLGTVNFFLFSGICVAPLAGFTIDMSRAYLTNTSSLVEDGSDHVYWSGLRPLAISTFICSTVTTLLSCLVLIPNEGLFYFVFALLALCRGFLFSNLSASLLMAFPLRYFGKLFGLAFLVGGLMSMLQYALLEMTTNYFVVSNIILIIISACSFSHPIQIFIGSKPSKSNNNLL